MSLTPAAQLSPPLLAWYDRHARSLPWRGSPTPYEVLLSELMLQQTRVETVKPYFARFLARWPTLADLAAADLDEVLREWAGLGYYARARNLHRCAEEATRLGGLPQRYEALLTLPGIGPYTAGAIASIAFGEAVPAVDGNVERVLSRVDGRQADPRSTAGKRDLRERATALLTGGRCGDLNQALMELGATVCTPRSPDCGACPWRNACVARATGQQETLPHKAPRKAPVPIAGVSGLLRTDRGLLLARRPPGGLLGGLWEPPRVALEPGQDPAVEVVAALHACTGLEVGVTSRLGEVVHVFTHRRLTLVVFDLVHRAGEARPSGPYDALRWIRDPGEVGLSTLARKVLALEQRPPLFRA